MAFGLPLISHPGNVDVIGPCYFCGAPSSSLKGKLTMEVFLGSLILILKKMWDNIALYYSVFKLFIASFAENRQVMTAYFNQQDSHARFSSHLSL